MLPRLRYLEAHPDDAHRRMVLTDPTRLAKGAIVAGGADLLLLTLLDGTRSNLEVQADYARHTGRSLPGPHLDALLGQLTEAGFLDGPGFEDYYQDLLKDYRGAAHRPLRDPDGFGAPAQELADYLDRALGAVGSPTLSGRLVGLVAPHLDFPRGLPCYGPAYRLAATHPGPLRVVILGTNHFGRSRSVVATRQHFATPLGVVPTDLEFLARLGAECGGNLYPYELDHLHEHSIELQTVWLRQVFGSGVRVVPVLCPDPCTPHGTAAGDAGGVDMREFALALGALVRNDPTPTLMVASADLSHVGRFFGDERDLTDEFLAQVRSTDEAALALLEANQPEGFRAHLAATRNPTRMCSIGCLYALMTALGPNAEPRRLHYHQAVTPDIDNCVTCAAYAFVA